MCNWVNEQYCSYLEIYDGSNDLSTQITKLSGNLGSLDISSMGNSLFVKFVSSHNIDGSKGFLATIHYGKPYLIEYQIIL